MALMDPLDPLDDRTATAKPLPLPSPKMHRVNCMIGRILTMVMRAYSTVAIPGFLVLGLFFGIGAYQSYATGVKFAGYRFEFAVVTSFPDGNKTERTKEFATPTDCIAAIIDLKASKFDDDDKATRDVVCRAKTKEEK